MNTIFFLLYSLSIITVLALGNCLILYPFIQRYLYQNEFEFIILMVISLIEIILLLPLTDPEKGKNKYAKSDQNNTSELYVSWVVITLLLGTLFLGYWQLFELYLPKNCNVILKLILGTICVIIHISLIHCIKTDPEEKM